MTGAVDVIELNDRSSDCRKKFHLIVRTEESISVGAFIRIE